MRYGFVLPGGDAADAVPGVEIKDHLDYAALGVVGHEHVALAVHYKGVAPARVFKTLVTEVDGVPTVAVVPVTGELDLKGLASAAGGKRANLADRALAERVTGYVRGGISPFGQRRRLPTVIDATVTGFATVFCGAGKRGLQVELDPADLIRLTSCSLSPRLLGPPDPTAGQRPARM